MKIQYICIKKTLSNIPFQAIDAGDTIFVHTFGAYFGLAASRIIYHRYVDESKNNVSAEIWLVDCKRNIWFRNHATSVLLYSVPE